MKRRGNFVNNHFYHTYNRGTEKRNIFCDDADYERFMEILKEFNCENSLRLFQIRELRKIEKYSFSKTGLERGKKLVDIVCFCLMPNHFHLVLKQRVSDGISLFIKKICTGYACYFNKRYKRNGCLFQGRFKSTLIEDDIHLVHLTRYTHLNPLKLLSRRSDEKISDCLKSYKWSSYNDFIGENFFRVSDPETILRLSGGVAAYKKSIDEWGKRKFEELRKMIWS